MSREKLREELQRITERHRKGIMLMERMLPPHDGEVERWILRAMMIDRPAAQWVVDRLVEEDFYVASHRKLFSYRMLLWEATLKPEEKVIAKEKSAELEKACRVTKPTVTTNERDVAKACARVRALRRQRVVMAESAALYAQGTCSGDWPAAARAAAERIERIKLLEVPSGTDQKPQAAGPAAQGAAAATPVDNRGAGAAGGRA